MSVVWVLIALGDPRVAIDPEPTVWEGLQPSPGYWLWTAPVLGLYLLISAVAARFNTAAAARAASR